MKQIVLEHRTTTAITSGNPPQTRSWNITRKLNKLHLLTILPIVNDDGVTIGHSPIWFQPRLDTGVGIFNLGEGLIEITPDGLFFGNTISFDNLPIDIAGLSQLTFDITFEHWSASKTSMFFNYTLLASVEEE